MVWTVVCTGTWTFLEPCMVVLYRTQATTVLLGCHCGLNSMGRALFKSLPLWTTLYRSRLRLVQNGASEFFRCKRIVYREGSSFTQNSHKLRLSLSFLEIGMGQQKCAFSRNNVFQYFFGAILVSLYTRSNTVGLHQLKFASSFSSLLFLGYKGNISSQKRIWVSEKIGTLNKYWNKSKKIIWHLRTISKSSKQKNKQGPNRKGRYRDGLHLITLHIN